MIQNIRRPAQLRMIPHYQYIHHEVWYCGIVARCRILSRSFASTKPESGQIKKRVVHVGQMKKKDQVSGSKQLVKAGLPLILFSILGAWVVSNAYSGKLKEMEASQGKVSKSVRQAVLEEEHDEMMERLSKIVQADFDNTKRIKRPEEVLEERRLARERRNAWHRRLYRWVFRKSADV